MINGACRQRWGPRNRLCEPRARPLAGRAALLELLPLSASELRRGRWLGKDVFEVMFRGGYPAPYQRAERHRDWLADYVRTYVERDVRQVLAVGDLLAFQTFLRLAATRTGQLVNLSQLGSDAGVTHNTAKSWLGILEASYIVARVAPFFRNVGNRLVKTPKLHFLDSGLACYLLGIRTPQELEAHPLRGAIFESWVVSEAHKLLRNRNAHGTFTFFRDAHGLEVDLLVERGRDILAIEAKGGQTVAADALAPLDALAKLLPDSLERVIAYAGDEAFTLHDARVVPYHKLDVLDWGEDPPPLKRATQKRKRVSRR